MIMFLVMMHGHEPTITIQEHPATAGEPVRSDPDGEKVDRSDVVSPAQSIGESPFGTVHPIDRVQPETTVPSSWKELNEQPFCRSTRPQLQSFEKFLFDVQFNADCDDPDRKFLIFDLSRFDGMGFTAAIGQLELYFFFGLLQQRTVLFSGMWDWARDAEYCKGTAGMECYFLPISNCDADSLLKHADSTDIQQDVLETQKPAETPYSERRIVHILPKSTSWPMIYGDVEHWADTNFDVTLSQIEAVYSAFVTRPNQQVCAETESTSFFVC